MSSGQRPQTIAQLMHNMPRVFHPERAEGVNADVQFHFTGQEPGDWVLSIRDGQASVREGQTDSPTATITSPSEVWMAVSLGETNPMVAFMSGQFKASGDMALLMRLQSMFG